MSTTIKQVSRWALPILCPLAAVLIWTGTGAGQATRDSDKDALDQARRLNEVAAQKLEADVRKARDDAKGLAKSDPLKAVDVLKKTLALLEDDRSLKEERRDQLKRMIKLEMRGFESDAEDAARRDRDRTSKLIQDVHRRADEKQLAAEQAEISQTLTRIRTLQRDGRTSEANRLADELARRFPNNPVVQASLRTGSAGERLADARDMQRTRERLTVGVYNSVDGSAIPPKDDIEFPKDWREKSERRAKLGVRMTAKEKAIIDALKSPITVDYEGTPFQDVIDHLSKKLGVPIIIDKQAIDDVQVTYKTPVTVQVKGVSLRTVLRKVLGEMGLAYIVKDEAIQVMTAAKAKDIMTVRAYYLGDLVATFDPRLPPALNQLQMIQNVNQLVALIQSIDPQSWQANGGNGTILFDPTTMSLIVKQSAEVHLMLGPRY